MSFMDPGDMYIYAAAAFLPDGSFNGVEVLWLAVLGALCAVIGYARGRDLQQQEEVEAARTSAWSPDPMGAGMDEVFRWDEPAWPKEKSNGKEQRRAKARRNQ